MTGRKSGGNSAFGGVLWSFAERVSAQLVTMIVTIVLARLLEPSEYAVVAIVTVFVTLANVFVTSGFGTALVQKIDADNIDFSTTLYFSLSISVIVYLVLFLAAPFIAGFYEIPLLTSVVRVMSLRLIFAAVNSIQQAYVARRMEFKKFFFATLIGTIISAFVGIGMAYGGFGVWALVAQYLTNVAVDTLVLGVTCGWKPELVFSYTRLKPLYSYGWKIIVSDLINKTCEQARSLVLGKATTPEQLSYYNQGEKFPALFINNIETSMQKALAPVVAKAQDDKKRVLYLTRQSIRVSTFLIWPLLFGMFAVAEPMIRFLYTDKWLGSVPYVRLVCMIYLIYPIGEAHVRTIKALGRSDLFMRSMIMSQIIGVAMLTATVLLHTDAKWIVGSWAGSMGSLMLLNAIENYKLIDYRFTDQIKDVLGVFLSCVVMAVLVSLCGRLQLGSFMMLLIQVAVGGCTYIIVSYFLSRDTWCYLMQIIKNRIGKRGRAS